MNAIINALEEQNNLLNYTKNNLYYKTATTDENRNTQITLIEANLLDIKLTAENITNIIHIKDLVFRQLTEFINKLDQQYNSRFSKSQGLSYYSFYFEPLQAIKKLLFYDYSGISGANLNLTIKNEDEDEVKDKVEFVNFLKKVREEFNTTDNLYDLYLVFKFFDNGIKSQFREVVDKN